MNAEPRARDLATPQLRKIERLEKKSINFVIGTVHSVKWQITNMNN